MCISGVSAVLRRVPMTVWLAAIGMTLLACSKSREAHLSGVISLRYVGASGSDAMFTLENGLSKEIGFRGDYVGSASAYAWDTEVSCYSESRREAFAHGPSLVDGGGVSYVDVSPGKQIHVLLRNEFGVQEQGARCHFSLTLVDGTSIKTPGDFIVAENGQPDDSKGIFEATRVGFVNDPGKTASQALQASAPDCWPEIKGSEEALDSLVNDVAKGDLGAAKYLAPRFSELDGGDLEDATAALGEFSDHHMSDFLALTQSGLLGCGEMTRAVSVLPLELSDDFQAQLVRMRKRRLAAVQVSDPSLANYRKAVISAIDAAIEEIKRGMTLSREAN